MMPIQLFDPASCTYTYILFDEATRDALIIDPTDEEIERDLAQLRTFGLKLAWTVETHTHADHITSAGILAEHTGALTAAPEGCGIATAAVQLKDGDTLRFGGEQILALHTPGHTAGSMSFAWRGNVFTGDALLIDGCGRTDFQGGDAGVLYDSIHARLFTLPDITRVYPAHDYRGNAVSTIGWEKRHNARLANRSRADFIDLMAHLNLPRPKMMDVAVPANRNLGIVPHAA
jgi:glyoxylase-like metal-dependent hydrolase (beta-lactamase superfamily II)